MAALLIFLTFALLCVIFIKPKWGSMLVWFVLFCYPHGWWANNQFLPLNIGFDDLYCLVLFILIVVRRNILEGLPLRLGYSLLVVTAFTIIAIVANLNGMSMLPYQYKILILKNVMKVSIYWAMFYSIVHCIDNVEDLKKQFSFFILAAVVGAVLVIVHYFQPRLVEPWTYVLAMEDKTTFHGRAYGAFGNPNNGACVLIGSLCLMMSMMHFRKKLRSKIIGICFIAILLVAILLTKSRAGLIALSGTIFLMATFSKARKVAITVIFSGVIIAALFAGGEVMRGYTERLGRVYNKETKNVDTNVEGRIWSWKQFFKTATPRIYLLGQGAKAGRFRNNSETHSTYVSIVTVYGFGCIVWVFASLGGFLKRFFYLKQSPDPFLNTLVIGLFWALFSWGICGIAADTLSSQYPRFLLFYLVALMGRAYCIERQGILFGCYEDSEMLDLQTSSEMGY